MVHPDQILIVGAGIAGLTAARQLSDAGLRVVVCDKGRGLGGRMATRRIGEQRFDHGAQYFSAVSPRFRKAVAGWVGDGIAEEWFQVNGTPRYRGSQGMNAIAKHLAAGLDIRLSTRVVSVEPDGRCWRATTEGGERISAAGLILTAPVPQSLEILGDCKDLLPSSLPSVSYHPCFALMAALNGPSGLPTPGFQRIQEGPLTWIADNTKKGITTGPGALTMHASPLFTRVNYDAPAAEVAEQMMEAAGPWLGGARIAEWQLHRWRYSLVSSSGPEPCCNIPSQAPLVLAGDAFGGARVEGAFLSGYAAALALLESRVS